uniref:Uncharacterized protein n=1 Tax=Lygus hesperus TaxID=30085 RepID=A0A0A9W698_LYGHE
MNPVITRIAPKIYKGGKCCFFHTASTTIANGVVKDSPNVATTGEVSTTLCAHSTSLKFVPISVFSTRGQNCLGVGKAKCSTPEVCKMIIPGHRKNKLITPTAPNTMPIA